MASNSLANKNSTVRALGEASPDPVPDYLFKYNLDGNDTSLTRFGGDDYRSGPACEDENEDFGGYSAFFSRTLSQYYTSSDTALTGVGTGAFTFCFWVSTYRDELMGLVSTGTGDGLNNFRIRTTTDGRIQFRSNSQSVNTIDMINTGGWRHVSVVSSGSGGTLTFYFDGVLESSQTAPAYDLDGSGSLELGSILGANFYIGGMDDVRFYGRDLPVTDVGKIVAYRCDADPLQLNPVFSFEPNDFLTITATGNDVSQMDDRSTNGLDATQTVLANRPETRNQNINLINVLDFNTAALDAEFMDLPDMSSYIDGSGDRFYIFVARSDDPIIRHYFFNSGPGVVNGDAFTITCDANKLAVRIGGSNYTSNFNMGTDGIYAVGLNGNSLADLVLWKNAVSSQGTGTEIIDTDASSNNAIGVRPFSPTNKWKGVLGSFVALDKYPTDEEREFLEGYMAWKHALVSLLPSGHPYKSAPPRGIS